MTDNKQGVLAAPKTVTTELVLGVNPYSQGVSVTEASFQGEVIGSGSDGTTYVLSHASETSKRRSSGIEIRPLTSFRS